MMLKADLPAFAKRTLRHILHRPGEVLYSSHETLRPGAIYLMGFNPGGEGISSIESHINQMFTRTTNSYLDEEWENRSGRWAAGKAPLQLRIQWILGQLGLKTEEVCASNLIFQTSRSSDGVSFGLAGICWPFHEAVIDIVKPRLLLTFGNGSGSSTYAFVKELFWKGEEDELDFGHGKAMCKGFSAESNNPPAEPGAFFCEPLKAAMRGR